MDPTFLVVLVVAAVLTTVWHYSRGRDLLRRWAEREGFVLVSAHYSFWPGPFWWRSGRGNVIYRVVVRDRQGGFERSGYARCGGVLLGMFSDEVQVIWD